MIEIFLSDQPAENDPILAFIQYYEAGNHSLANLIKIRSVYTLFETNLDQICYHNPNKLL